jgi:hypothetical protein
MTLVWQRWRSVVVVAVIGVVEPVQRATPCFSRGVRVEACACVVEEGMIGLAEREQLVPQPGCLSPPWPRGWWR